jgi:hypothetical protein
MMSSETRGRLILLARYGLWMVAGSALAALAVGVLKLWS